MKKIQLHLFIVTIFSFSACTKGGDFDINLDNFLFDLQVSFTLRSHFDSLGLQYMKIPEGRTFQYRDSSSNQIITVKSIKSDTSAISINSTTRNKLYIDKYSLELIQITNLRSGINWYVAESKTDTNMYSIPDIYDSEFELTNEVNKVASFWYPFINTSVGEHRLLTNQIIEGKSYNEVHLFHASNGLPNTDPAYIESWYYWVKGIGIVERRIKTNGNIKTEYMTKYF